MIKINLSWSISPTDNKVTSLQKAFRSPGVLVLDDFGIFCLFLPLASREVKINRKCLTWLPKLGSSATGNNSHSALQYGTCSNITPNWDWLVKKKKSRSNNNKIIFCLWLFFCCRQYVASLTKLCDLRAYWGTEGRAKIFLEISFFAIMWISKLTLLHKWIL